MLLCFSTLYCKEHPEAFCFFENKGTRKHRHSELEAGEESCWWFLHSNTNNLLKCCIPCLFPLYCLMPIKSNSYHIELFCLKSMKNYHSEFLFSSDIGGLFELGGARVRKTLLPVITRRTLQNGETSAC